MEIVEKKIAPSNKSFSIYRSLDSCQDDYLHYHEELELIYVVKGSGLRFIGDHVQEFSEGDLALIGSNIPHLYKNSPEYVYNTKLKTDTLILHFNSSFLGKDFFEIRELVLIKELLKNSIYGIEFRDKNTILAVKQLLIQLLDLSAFDSIQTILTILHKLANCLDRTPIASSPYQDKSSYKDSSRINKVYQFVLENFQNDINLNDVADIANLGISPFCRFFKKRTHKSFFEFLNEVRVGHACKLLIDNTTSINEVAFKSGFNSQTNFNRQFKKIKKRSPAAFRKMYLNQ